MNSPAPAIVVPDTLPKRERALPPIAINADVTPMQMLAIATQDGADVEKLKMLMDLRDRWEAGEARKAFVTAMAAFKAEPISILKTKEVNIPGGAKFMHATLANVVDGAVAALSKHGLSHRWVIEQPDPKLIKVTCILTHEKGHSEQSVFMGPPDDSGKKSPIQQIASTTTFGQRYTLMAVCGLAAKDMEDADDPGRGKQKPEPPEGYEDWSMDMDAKAEEGKAAHLAAWTGSKQAFRNYATAHDLDWWTRSKNKAAKVGP